MCIVRQSLTPMQSVASGDPSSSNPYCSVTATHEIAQINVGDVFARGVRKTRASFLRCIYNSRVWFLFPDPCIRECKTHSSHYINYTSNAMLEVSRGYKYFYNECISANPLFVGCTVGEETD